nr:hypothetical protein [Tanacetum cinerariifolium]
MLWRAILDWANSPTNLTFSTSKAQTRFSASNICLDLGARSSSSFHILSTWSNVVCLYSFLSHSISLSLSLNYLSLSGADGRVIPDAMMWKHIDTDVQDDFLISYNESNAELISIDYFLSFSEWNRTVVSKGEPIPDNERPLVRITTLLLVGFVILEKNAGQNCMDRAKRIGELSSAEPKKKKAQRNARFSLVRSLRLNRDYIDLHNHSDVHLEELNHLRTDCVRERQSNEGFVKEFGTRKISLIFESNLSESTAEGTLIRPQDDEQDFTSTNWRHLWNQSSNCQSFRMTIPTFEQVTPVNQVTRDDDIPNNSPSLQDKILDHVSSLKALIKKHIEGSGILIELIHLSFSDEDRNDKGKGVGKRAEDAEDEDL